MAVSEGMLAARANVCSECEFRLEHNPGPDSPWGRWCAQPIQGEALVCNKDMTIRDAVLLTGDLMRDEKSTCPAGKWVSLNEVDIAAARAAKKAARIASGTVANQYLRLIQTLIPAKIGEAQLAARLAPFVASGKLYAEEVTAIVNAKEGPSAIPG